MSLYRMELDEEFGEPFYNKAKPDFARVARLYVESPEAQHGDEALARCEAREWWRLFEMEAEEQ